MEGRSGQCATSQARLIRRRSRGCPHAPLPWRFNSRECAANVINNARLLYPSGFSLVYGTWTRSSRYIVDAFSITSIAT